MVVLLLGFLSPTKSACQESGIEGKPYSCVPAAASLVCAYFGKPHSYEEIYGETKVLADGQAPLGDLVRSCEKRGLKCAAYTNISLETLKRHCRLGCVAVVNVKIESFDHVYVVFDVDGTLHTTDLIEPLHPVNEERLSDILNSKLPCVFVSETDTPAIFLVVLPWWVYWIPGGILSVFLVLVWFFRRGQKK